MAVAASPASPAVTTALQTPAKEPRFREGQIVAFKGQTPKRRLFAFRVLEAIFLDGEYYYRWNRNNAAAEHMLRELTEEEIRR